MTYKEKQVWVTVVSGIIMFALYMTKAIRSYLAEGSKLLHNLEFWSKTMLIYIGIGIGLVIIMLIVFNIYIGISIEVRNKINRSKGLEPIEHEEYEDVEDEMVQLINLKSNQVGYVIVGIGFVAGLITLALNMAPGIMLNIVFLSFMTGALLDGLVKLYYYNRGVTHG